MNRNQEIIELIKFITDTQRNPNQGQQIQSILQILREILESKLTET